MILYLNFLIYGYIDQLYLFWQPSVANIIQFGFIVEHTHTLLSHNPQTQSIVAFGSISIILVDIKVIRKARPLEGTVKLC